MLPNFFLNPTKFDPSKFEQGLPPFTFVLFAGGPHIMCIGNEFAKTKIMVFLHHLVLNYEWLIIHPSEKISYDPMPIFKRGLPLEVHIKA
jgi:cytochrome P450 family 26 subfamily A